jgi:hypothetical protein
MCTTIAAHGTDKKQTEKKLEDEKGQPVVYMTEEEVKAMLDKLSSTDKAALKNIQDQILNWPKQVFDEVKAYREFIINSRKAAKEKYEKLSEAAKEAMRIEESMKTLLSTDALNTLATIKIQ